MKRSILIVLLCSATACSRHAAHVDPLAPRPCPPDSVELTNVNHCFDPPACNHVESMNGKLCMAVNPANGKPLGVFAKGDCNPFANQDCDDPEPKGKKQHKEND